MSQTILERTRRINDWFVHGSTARKIVVGILLLFLLFLIIRSRSRGAPNQQFVTATVESGTIVDTISESGNIQAASEFDVYSTITGTIQEIFVKNGDNVAAGVQLFRVKSTATDQDKATALTTYRNAQSSLKTAKQVKLSDEALLWQKRKAVADAQNAVNFKNSNDVNPQTKASYTDLEKQSIDDALIQAQKDLQATQQKFENDNTAITAAESQVNSTHLAYLATQDAIISSPNSGTVSNLAHAVGDKVTPQTSGAAISTSGASSSATAATSPVLIVGDLSNYNVNIQLNEVEIGKVKLGQQADVTIDAIPGKTFKGSVTRVDDFGTNTSGVITYNIYISIDKADPSFTAIRPNMSARAIINVQRKENVLLVPNSAIKPYKNGKAVLVPDLKGGRNAVKYIPVEIGIKSVTETEIVKGLKKGQTIIISTSGTGQANPQSTTPGPRGPFGGG